jgi:hypothetical protein
MREERVLGNRRVAGAGQFRSAPVHRSESPTGYSSAGCSPAEPASASPVTDNSNSIPIRRDNQMRCSTSLKDPVQASVTCLDGATSGSIPDLVRPRPAFG